MLYFRRFIETKLPELRILNQNTFFSIAEINDKFKTKSSCHFIYGDGKNILMLELFLIMMMNDDRDNK